MTSSTWVLLGRPCDRPMLRGSPAVVPSGLRLRRTVGSRILSSLPSCDSSYRAWNFTPVGLAPTDHASFAGRNSPPNLDTRLGDDSPILFAGGGTSGQPTWRDETGATWSELPPGSRIVVGVLRTSRLCDVVVASLSSNAHDMIRKERAKR